MSKLLRMCALVGSLGFPLLGFGQGGFTPDGGESAIAGAMRTDQVHPDAAITHQGGYLVWQDNLLQGERTWIRAHALNTDLAKVGPTFRVNAQPLGNHEKPQVALLRGGGAVFVWEGGRKGFANVYARFLSASGLFITSDIRVNRYTNSFQASPQVATLADGSVVVVWSSSEQDGSFQGVYGQRFSPLGARLGSEFRINQVTANNQRTPAIAALTNGNFVVAWVSELQRGASSVDVFARLFTASSATGTPAPLVDQPNEFAVNLSATNMCANPSVASSLVGGGFAVAWSQFADSLLTAGSLLGTQVSNPTTSRSTNSWDVFARLFGAGGTAITGVVPLNTTTYGDQYAPQINAFGDRYMAVWTSLKQDGSREGVFGQYVSGDGLPIGGEFQVNTLAASRQLEPVLVSDNHARVMAVWTSFVGGGNGFDLRAQIFATADVIPFELITNSLPAVHEPGNRGLPKLAFPTPVETEAAPSPNPFAASAGNYNGLFFERDGINIWSSGSLTLKLTSKGAYSGKLISAGKSYPLKGTFDEGGWAVSVTARKSLPPITTYLQLDMASGDQIQGAVTDGDWLADMHADRQVFDKVTHLAPQAGRYTMLIQGSTNGPSGEGVGTVTVDAAGVIKWTGTLADGTKVTQTSVVSRNGYWPLYAGLSAGSEAIVSWVQFTNQAASDFAGPLVWVKQGGGAKVIHRAGFTNEIFVSGSRYTAPAAGQRILNFASGSISLSAGNLPLAFSNPINLGEGNKVTSPVTGFKMSFVPASGLFKGTSPTPLGGTISFQGVVLPKVNRGGGFFLGTSESGRVTLSPVE